MTVTVTADVVAWYAAVVSTVSACVTLWLGLRDRPKVRIVGRAGYKVVDRSGEYDPSKLYISVTVINCGRRPITIGKVAIRQKGRGQPYLLLSDSIRFPPRELSEGKATDYILDQSGINLTTIRDIIAYDMTGHEWRGHLEKRKA